VIGIDTIYLLCRHCLSSKAEREEISMKESRTENAKTIQEGTLIVAVDIGMTSSHGYCAAADGRSTKTVRFDNTREGRSFSVIILF
jgi:hypothetical protein